MSPPRPHSGTTQDGWMVVGCVKVQYIGLPIEETDSTILQLAKYSSYI